MTTMMVPTACSNAPRLTLYQKIDSPNMCIKSNFATFRCRKCACSSRMAVRIMADSFAMTARSSAAVLQARTLRIKSRNFIDMMEKVVQLLLAVLCVCLYGFLDAAARDKFFQSNCTHRKGLCARLALCSFSSTPVTYAIVSYNGSLHTCWYRTVQTN